MPTFLDGEYSLDTYKNPYKQHYDFQGTIKALGFINALSGDFSPEQFLQGIYVLLRDSV